MQLVRTPREKTKSSKKMLLPSTTRYRVRTARASIIFPRPSLLVNENVEREKWKSCELVSAAVLRLAAYNRPKLINGTSLAGFQDIDQRQMALEANVNRASFVRRKRNARVTTIPREIPSPVNYTSAVQEDYHRPPGNVRLLFFSNFGAISCSLMVEQDCNFDGLFRKCFRCFPPNFAKFHPCIRFLLAEAEWDQSNHRESQLCRPSP